MDEKNIPGPRSWPFVGSLYKYTPIVGEYTFHDRDATSSKMYKKYGKIVRQEITPGIVWYHLFDPDDIETVFRNESKAPQRMLLEGVVEYCKQRNRSPGINVNGEKWKRLRSNSQKPMLRPRNVSAYIPLQDRIGADFIKRLRSIRDPETNEIPDLLNEFYKWAVESIGVVIFDKRIGTLDGNLGPDSEAQKFIQASNSAIDAMYHTTIYWPLHRGRATAKWKQLCSSLDFIWEVSMKYSREAMQKIKKGNVGKDSSILGSFLSDPDISFEDCLALSTDLLSAGVDTTSHTTAYLLYHLAANKKSQTKLQEEIDRELTPGEAITAQTFDKLQYMKAVLKESQRLNPIVGSFSRRTEKDLVLSGYKIPTGSFVFCEVAVMCGMSKYFSDPDEFIPERWLRSESCQKQGDFHPYVFLPFGHGARSCIGRRFAEQEVYLLLIKLMQNFNVENHHGYIGRRTRLINTPAKPLKFAFIDRR
ncbi:hypothetical protein CAPTEDRAFT_125634 [Capitella teleta]|uniref:Cytochrome P450 n=1 Tax=Capitella teleta TaxID=283909 RepID=R7U2V0_CAPTE|nr:hypothetical protein CAPTEDRAFT_125634 [Capitella teleta]|eukprot:ELU00675.1 hypothetical protein CAPTEDRAFT_125634 [Capitella teleta]